MKKIRMIHPLFPCIVEKMAQSKAFGEEIGESNTIKLSPLEPGLASILGNLIRRLLYRYTSGTAITSAWISGARHELSPLEGFQEEIPDILHAFSRIPVRMDHYGPAQIFLKKQGPGTVTTNDLVPSLGVEILSRPTYLFSLNGNASAYMVLNVEVGKGSFEGQGIRLQNYKKQYFDDPISQALDKQKNALLGCHFTVPHQFSPIRKVTYLTNSYTHYDELILTVITNGTIDASDAFEGALIFFLQKLGQIRTASSSNKL